MILLYTDECVRGPIIRGLRRRGIDVLTAVEDGMDNTPDPLVLDRATELGRLLYAEDRDMLREAERRQTEGTSFLGVVYAHPLRVSIGKCVECLEVIATLGTLEEFVNRVEYLSFWKSTR